MGLFDDDFKISVLGDWVSESKLISENGVPKLITRDIGTVSRHPFDNRVLDIKGNLVGKMIGGHFEHWPGRPFRWPE